MLKTYTLEIEESDAKLLRHVGGDLAEGIAHACRVVRADEERLEAAVPLVPEIAAYRALE